MSDFSITGVSVAPAPGADLLGCFIDAPKGGTEYESFCLDVRGWVCGRSSPVATVEVLSEGVVLQKATVEQPRPDLAKAFPASPIAGNSGFGTQINLVLVPAEFELSLVLAYQDARRHPFATIHGSRNRFELGEPARIQPLLVTTLGRTGSTWVMMLLAQHRNIVTYRPFELETRAGAYWVQVFLALSDPKSYRQPVVTTKPSGQWWLGDSLTSLPDIPDPAVLDCLGASGVRALASFCQARLSAFYSAAAVAGHIAGPRYLAEKYLVDPLTRRMIREWYPRSRELILVRDPRDMFCSIEAFNAKRGYVAFARDQLTDPEHYLRMLMQQTRLLVQQSKTRPEKMHLLRYEDLVQQPLPTMRAMLEYLDLPSGTELVNDIVERGSRETKLVRLHRTSHSTGESVGRWRRELPESLQHFFVSEFGDVLGQLGYE
jgi:hypothetical protein